MAASEPALLWPVVDLGDWVASPRILDELGESWAAELLARHQACDWGDVDDDGEYMNWEALQNGEAPICSFYRLPAGNVLIETEGDRSETRVFFIEEEDQVWKEQHEQE